MVSFVSSTVLFFGIQICSMLHFGDEKMQNIKKLNIFCISLLHMYGYMRVNGSKTTVM